ncbi:hypothetical protein CG51_19860 [Haematobacter missouriensis]|nr:DciA family protein [Haematobacter missouriensis]KFI32804.1 hypothetical protein CG51_19860 [Haematobacter missouriensis]
MPRKTKPSFSPPSRRMRGFEPAAGLLGERIRQAGEKRGFAVARLLTHWAEIVGPEIAGMARPVKMSYGQQGLGATLTLLTTGAKAQMLQMQLPSIITRVNACYGYSAVSRISITQTAPTGFADGHVAFTTPQSPQKPQPAPEITRRAAEATGGVQDEGLRAALERLGQNVIARAPGKDSTFGK